MSLAKTTARSFFDGLTRCTSMTDVNITAGLALEEVDASYAKARRQTRRSRFMLWITAVVVPNPLYHPHLYGRVLKDIALLAVTALPF